MDGEPTVTFLAWNWRQLTLNENFEDIEQLRSAIVESLRQAGMSVGEPVAGDSHIEASRNGVFNTILHLGISDRKFHEVVSTAGPEHDVTVGQNAEVVETIKRVHLPGMLNFTMQHQTQSGWCWAATSASIAQFYDPSTTWTQCKVADGETGRMDCCGTGASGPCNVAGFLGEALTRVGHFNRMVDGPISREDVQSEIGFGRPVCVRMAWRGGGAHFVAIAGYIENDLIVIHDPVSGVHNVDYDIFTTSYLGSGSWTHSYFTRR